VLDLLDLLSGFSPAIQYVPMHLMCNENGDICGVSRRYSRRTAPLVMSPSAQLASLLAGYAGVLFDVRGQQRTTRDVFGDLLVTEQ
jgi:hypothetical protein